MAILLLISCSVSAPVPDGYFKGENYLGKTKQCQPMKQKMCTEIFTQEDQFAVECRDKGYQAIQCDCHSWICVTN